MTDILDYLCGDYSRLFIPVFYWSLGLFIPVFYWSLSLFMFVFFLLVVNPFYTCFFWSLSLFMFVFILDYLYLFLKSHNHFAFSAYKLVMIVFIPNF